MATESLDVSKKNHVATITLKGPGKGNALGQEFWNEIPAVMRGVDEDDDIRVAIVVGSGDHFSYGLDLIGMAAELGPLIAGQQLAKGRARLLDLIRRLQDAVSRVESCRKPVLAAIHGWCIGGGLDLAAACDQRLCSREACFSLREARVAMVADLGSLQRLPHIIGEGHSRELAYTARDFDADHALRIGLVGEVLDDRDALLERARAIAGSIAKNPPLVVQGIKQVMNHARRRRTAEDLDYVAVWNSAFLQSHDLTEAMTAFMEKREPEFGGE